MFVVHVTDLCCNKSQICQTREYDLIAKLKHVTQVTHKLLGLYTVLAIALRSDQSVMLRQTVVFNGVVDFVAWWNTQRRFRHARCTLISCFFTCPLLHANDTFLHTYSKCLYTRLAVCSHTASRVRTRLAVCEYTIWLYTRLAVCIA